MGDKRYELTNHLGNVLATVSDRKNPQASGGQISDYTADLTTAARYYPFGALLSDIRADRYRFGFNGQEKDDEITGSTGSHYTAENWEYDSRIG